jgi:hypothetical protein
VANEARRPRGRSHAGARRDTHSRVTGAAAAAGAGLPHLGHVCPRSQVGSAMRDRQFRGAYCERRHCHGEALRFGRVESANLSPRYPRLPLVSRLHGGDNMGARTLVPSVSGSMRDGTLKHRSSSCGPADVAAARVALPCAQSCFRTHRHAPWRSERFRLHCCAARTEDPARWSNGRGNSITTLPRVSPFWRNFRIPSGLPERDPLMIPAGMLWRAT